MPQSLFWLKLLCFFIIPICTYINSVKRYYANKESLHHPLKLSHFQNICVYIWVLFWFMLSGPTLYFRISNIVSACTQTSCRAQTFHLPAWRSPFLRKIGSAGRLDTYLNEPGGAIASLLGMLSFVVYWVVSTPKSLVLASLHLLVVQLEPSLSGLRAPKRPIFIPSRLVLNR